MEIVPVTREICIGEGLMGACLGGKVAEEAVGSGEAAKVARAVVVIFRVVVTFFGVGLGNGCDRGICLRNGAWHDRVGVGGGRTCVSCVASACCDTAIGIII